MNTRPVGAELFHANGLMDKHDKANSLFRKSAKATENATQRIEFRLLTHNRTSASKGKMEENRLPHGFTI
jgi:hypothetical protein